MLIAHCHCRRYQLGLEPDSSEGLRDFHQNKGQWFEQRVRQGSPDLTFMDQPDQNLPILGSLLQWRWQWAYIGHFVFLFISEICHWISSDFRIALLQRLYPSFFGSDIWVKSESNLSQIWVQWRPNKNTKCPIDAHCHRHCRRDPRIGRFWSGWLIDWLIQ